MDKKELNKQFQNKLQKNHDTLKAFLASVILPDIADIIYKYLFVSVKFIDIFYYDNDDSYDMGLERSLFFLVDELKKIFFQIKFSFSMQFPSPYCELITDIDFSEKAKSYFTNNFKKQRPWNYDSDDYSINFKKYELSDSQSYILPTDMGELSNMEFDIVCDFFTYMVFSLPLSKIQTKILHDCNERKKGIFPMRNKIRNLKRRRRRQKKKYLENMKKCNLNTEEELSLD